MPHAPDGIGKLRLVLPAIAGPPKEPVALRVSATRHGVTVRNCRPAVVLGLMPKGPRSAVPVPAGKPHRASGTGGPAADNGLMGITWKSSPGCSPKRGSNDTST